MLESIRSKFGEAFEDQPLIVSSPGRINLLGEHTDYNQGFVMPAAIGKNIYVAISRATGNKSIIHSLRFNQSVTVEHNRISPLEKPGWANYFLGVLHQLAATGFKIDPFRCVFDGDLPVGAGLSSSAAVECAFTYALNELFELGMSRMQMIMTAQWAEHNYVGVQCGIMDQFASMMGRKNSFILLDCRDMSFEICPISLGNHTLLLCDTGVKHSLASSEYNTRRQECELGISLMRAQQPDINTLRDVSLDLLLQNASSLPSKIFNRCLYVVQENRRVLEGAQDLKAGKLEGFGEKMFETHEGLSSLYEVSCPELDFLVDRASRFTGVLGSRMMGGGFGGCTLNIIERGSVKDFVTITAEQYQREFGISMRSYEVTVGEGTSVIERPVANMV